MIEITPLQKLIFGKIFELTGPCNSIFIAGGAVTDLDHAGDIDVWFGKSNEKATIAFLKKCTIGHLTPPSQYGSATRFGDAYIAGIDWPIQVMLTSDDKPQDTLATFDISTHQWAYTSRGILIRGSHATDPHEPVQVLHTQNPSTMARYIKICRRYHQAVDIGQIQAFKQTMWPDEKKRSILDGVQPLSISYLLGQTPVQYPVIETIKDEDIPF